MSGGFTPKLIETTQPLSGWINVLASEHGMNKSVGITIDATSVTADAAGHKIVANGTVLTKIAATGKYKPLTGTSTSEVQTIGLGSASAGTVKITFAGEETAAIAYNATNATVQAALEALPNIAPGDVTVTGSDWPAVKTLTFGGDYKNQDVPVITAVGTGLTAGTITIATSTAGVGANDGGILVNGGVDLKDGDVITGMLVHGSVLRARIPNWSAEAEASLSHIIFQ